MSTLITTAEAIPAAPYYVLSDDAFMSDWGEAKGRVNTIILPCSDRAEAEIVATNARNRDEQRRLLRGLCSELRPPTVLSPQPLRVP